MNELISKHCVKKSELRIFSFYVRVNFTTFLGHEFVMIFADIGYIYRQGIMTFVLSQTQHFEDEQI